MTEKKDPRPRRGEQAQAALEAANQALAAANAAVQAAAKALALSSETDKQERAADRARAAVASARRRASAQKARTAPPAAGPEPAPPAAPAPIRKAARAASQAAASGAAAAPEPAPAEAPATPPPVPAAQSPAPAAHPPAPTGSESKGRSRLRRVLFAAEDGPVAAPPPAVEASPEPAVEDTHTESPATPAPEILASHREAESRPAGAGPIRLGPSTAPAPGDPIAAEVEPGVEDAAARLARETAELRDREAEVAQREAAMSRYTPMETPRRVAAVPQADPNGFTVLVVDDEEQVRALTVRILTRYGYSVLEASGVEPAMSVLDSADAAVDLVLSDVAMPGLSGKDLFHAISTSRPGLPVVFMSGYALGVYAPEGLVEEGVKMLPKPFTQDALLEFVTEALGRPAAR